MSNPKLIISRLKEILETNKSVLGLVLVGSQTENKVYLPTAHSDIEAYIIVEDSDVGRVEKELPLIVNKLGVVVFFYKNRWAGFSTLFENLIRLELPVVKVSDLPTSFSRPTAQTVKVLIDKTQGKLENVLARRPRELDYEKLFQENYLDFWYMTVVGIQYLKNGELFNSRKVLLILLTSLIKNFELLQDRKILLLEERKRVEKFLNAEQLNLIKVINLAYNPDEVKKSYIKTMDYFSSSSKQVFQKYNYNYNSEIEDKIKQKLLHLLTP